MVTIINDLDSSPDEDNPEFDDDDDDANDKSYLTSDDPIVEGDHEVGKDDLIINDDGIQENYFNADNNVIYEIKEEMEQQDDVSIHSVEEGVGNMNPLGHIENDDNKDSIHENPPIDENSDDKGNVSDNEDNSILQDLEIQDYGDNDVNYEEPE